MYQLLRKSQKKRSTIGGDFCYIENAPIQEAYESSSTHATDTEHQRDAGRLTGGLSLAGATQSCIKCGKHRMMTMLKKQKLFGSTHTQYAKTAVKVRPRSAEH